MTPDPSPIGPSKNSSLVAVEVRRAARDAVPEGPVVLGVLQEDAQESGPRGRNDR